MIMMKILVIAAHPDDEVLGMGGTIKKLSKDNTIHLCVVSEGASAQYEDEQMIFKRQKACLNSGKILGIDSIDFFDFPDMKLDTIPHLEINRKLESVIKKFKPDIVFTTPYHDLNKDHLIVYQSTLVATRPYVTGIKKVLSYEIPGTTATPFYPTVYVNITKHISSKLNAFQKYDSELQPFPKPRSIESIKSLSMVRGVESGFKFAEAFHLVREKHF